VEVEIPRGAVFRGAMDALESAGIKVRRVEFETLARALRKERGIKAGSYEIAEPVTPTEQASVQAMAVEGIKPPQATVLVEEVHPATRAVAGKKKPTAAQKKRVRESMSKVVNVSV